MHREDFSVESQNESQNQSLSRKELLERSRAAKDAYTERSKECIALFRAIQEAEWALYKHDRALKRAQAAEVAAGLRRAPRRRRELSVKRRRERRRAAILDKLGANRC